MLPQICLENARSDMEKAHTFVQSSPEQKTGNQIGTMHLRVTSLYIMPILSGLLTPFKPLDRRTGMLGGLESKTWQSRVHPWITSINSSDAPFARILMKRRYETMHRDLVCPACNMPNLAGIDEKAKILNS